MKKLVFAAMLICVWWCPRSPTGSTAETTEFRR
jgi:hypothetical protein